MGGGGASRLDKSHHCPSLQREGQERGVWELLSIPGKVYGKVIIERVQRLTEEKISEGQGGFRKGRRYVDQIFSFRMVVEKILAKGKKIYAAILDLEKAYDKSRLASIVGSFKDIWCGRKTA